MEIVIVLMVFSAGVLLGALLSTLVLRKKESLPGEDISLSVEVARLKERVASKDTELARLAEILVAKEDEIGAFQEAEIADKTAITALKTQLDEERRQSIEKLKLLEEAKEQLKLEFNHVANRIFEEKSEKFTKESRENLDGVIKPLREQIKDFSRQVSETYEKESKERFGLSKELENLKQLNLQMSQDAMNLTNALKGQSQTQGAWGELILERILEASGLQSPREFETQRSYTTETGNRLQPDVIVHLPEGRDVIVDSKVTLVAYESYCSATEPSEREKAARQHVEALKGHVKNLSGKNYEGLPGVRTLDFVLLFMPIEGAFALAMEKEQGIFLEAFDRNIMIVSPSTLLITLRTVQNLWRYEDQNQNAQDIATRAGKLYDKFVGFLKELQDVGEKIKRARESYEEAEKKLSSGRGNLISQTEQLRKMGAKTKKVIDADLVERASEAVSIEEGDEKSR